MSNQLPHAQHIEELLALARKHEAYARERRQHNDPREALEYEHKARQLRHEAKESHNAHVANELERASSEPINLSDLMAGGEAFAIDQIERR